ncbi:MAG: DUF4258 domain-containing protein [Candidatus Korobacteraceae bacterium]
MQYVISDHARFEMKRRAIGEDIVQSILRSPEQRIDVRPGRIVLQSRVVVGTDEREYLVRVFVDIDRAPAEVVTVHRTSKIDKYWRLQS